MNGKKLNKSPIQSKFEHQFAPHLAVFFHIQKGIFGYLWYNDVEII